MKRSILSMLFFAIITLTMSDTSARSCDTGYSKRQNKKSASSYETSCGAKNVRQHRFASKECCPRKEKTNQTKNRKMKSCCN